MYKDLTILTCSECLLPYISKVQNETVSLVEATPAHRNLSSPHCSSACNMEDSMYSCPIRGHVSKP